MAGSAVERAYKLLKRQLLRGAIAVGEQIDIMGLCEQLGVSRTPVREALVALEKEGLVRAVPRRGYFAREPSFREALDAYQLRVILEPLATALAARRIGDGDLAMLRDLAVIAADGTDEAIERAVDRNRQFHVRIAEATGNQRLAKIMTQLLDDIERLLYIELDTENTYGQWSEEHLAIVAALEAHDPDRAAAASRATFKRDSMFLSTQAKRELSALLGPSAFSLATGEPTAERGETMVEPSDA
jgi:DNA-binding GntR family transcriptional regulator